MEKMLKYFLALTLASVCLVGCKPPFQRYTDIDGNRVEVQGDTVTIKGQDGLIAVAGGSNISWPKEKMGDLPELKGTISAIVNSNEGVMLTYNDMSRPVFDAYLGSIKKQGYESEYEANMGGTLMFSGKKDDNAITLQFSSDGDKGVCVLIYMEQS